MFDCTEDTVNNGRELRYSNVLNKKWTFIKIIVYDYLRKVIGRRSIILQWILEISNIIEGYDQSVNIFITDSTKIHKVMCRIVILQWKIP